MCKIYTYNRSVIAAFSDKKFSSIEHTFLRFPSVMPFSSPFYQNGQFWGFLFFFAVTFLTENLTFAKFLTEKYSYEMDILISNKFLFK